MDISILTRKLEECGLPIRVFAGVPPQLKQTWIRQTKMIVQMEQAVPANHPCLKDAEFKKNVKVCKELLRQLDVDEADWYVSEEQTEQQRHQRVKDEKPKNVVDEEKENVDLARNQLQELAIAEENRPLKPPRFQAIKETATPQKKPEPPNYQRTTQMTPRQIAVTTPKHAITPVVPSPIRTPLRGLTPTRLLRSAKAVNKMLDFGEGNSDKDLIQERAERQREEMLQFKSERTKKARENREEAARVKRLQLEQERRARLESKIREKSPVKSVVNSLKQTRERLQKSPYSPRVILKKALLHDKHVAVHITQTTSESPCAPKRKSRREDMENRVPYHREAALQKIELQADVELDSASEEPFDEVLGEPAKSAERTESSLNTSFVESEDMQAEDIIETSEKSKPPEAEANVLTESSKANQQPSEQVPLDRKANKTVSIDPMVNYGIDDLHSEDETDDEENPRKEIPDWAKGSALLRKVRTQAALKFNFDEYFGPTQDVVLENIFGLKKNFKPRSSSAVWNSPIHRPRPGFSTLDSSVVVEQVEEE